MERRELIALLARRACLAAIRPWRLYSRVLAAREDLRATRRQIQGILDAVGQLGETVGATSVAVSACATELEALRGQLARAEEAASARHQRALLALRMVRDNDAAAREELWAQRRSASYEAAFDEHEPLVSVIISTYSNWRLLRDRSLPSVLAQTYEHWEAIVVGDGAPDETRRAVESFGDPRIRFVNLPYRGPYPQTPADAWLVSGTTAWNTGLALANGRWIGTNDDDDALRPTYIESLFAHARERRAEAAYGYIAQHEPGERSSLLGTFPPAHAQWGLQAALLHCSLRFLPMQPSDWVFDVPNDSSLLERMLRIGVRFSFLEEPVVDYYPSGLWAGIDR